MNEGVKVKKNDKVKEENEKKNKGLIQEKKIMKKER